MDTNDNPGSIKNLLSRFNVIIFIVLLTGVLIFCILMLSSAISNPGTVIAPETTLRSDKTNFEASTEIQLEKLLPSSANTGNQPLPTGRINPFSE
ncbi:MAG: hypothetical protein WCI79_01010 [Candidatus Saccharibacteria bacterium]